ncbi:unknown [Dialister sp. CAG:486]|nr:unknown [Dialister sp. CAG:486]
MRPMMTRPMVGPNIEANTRPNGAELEASSSAGTIPKMMLVETM